MLLRTSVSLLCLSALVVQAPVAQAHHGWSWYGNEAFSLTGVVVEAEYGNPHDRLTVESGGQRWTLLLSPPARSRRAGLTEEAVKAGDTVTAHGHRRSSGDLFEMKTERLEKGDTLYNLYPDRS